MRGVSLSRWGTCALPHTAAPRHRQYGCQSALDARDCAMTLGSSIRATYDEGRTRVTQLCLTRAEATSGSDGTRL
jgi:hypothetical protein